MSGASQVSAASGSGDGATVVELRGVSKRFGASDGGVLALDEVDLTIRRGEVLSLIGPSGCGKSTLLRVVADLTAPTAGLVRVNGKPASAARRAREYGMVFQSPVLMDWRTVEQNVALPLEIMGIAGRERQRRAVALLDLVELGEFAGRFPWQLSGGMQQRVAIARALASDPQLLLMDEPFGALDEMTRERMNLELLSIWGRLAPTIVFVTHSIPEAVFLSTRVAVMSPRPGRIAEIVDVDLPQPRTGATRELDAYFRLVTRVREALRQNGGSDEPTADRVRAEGLS
jgi:NitT/TauT family transport system ATP-binding protein